MSADATRTSSAATAKQPPQKPTSPNDGKQQASSALSEDAQRPPTPINKSPSSTFNLTRPIGDIAALAASTISSSSNSTPTKLAQPSTPQAAATVSKPAATRQPTTPGAGSSTGAFTAPKSSQTPSAGSGTTTKPPPSSVPPPSTAKSTSATAASPNPQSSQPPRPATSPPTEPKPAATTPPAQSSGPAPTANNKAATVDAQPKTPQSVVNNHATKVSSAATTVVNPPTASKQSTAAPSLAKSPAVPAPAKTPPASSTAPATTQPPSRFTTPTASSGPAAAPKPETPNKSADASAQQKPASAPTSNTRPPTTSAPPSVTSTSPSSSTVGKSVPTPSTSNPPPPSVSTQNAPPTSTKPSHAAPPQNASPKIDATRTAHSPAPRNSNSGASDSRFSPATQTTAASMKTAFTLSDIDDVYEAEEGAYEEEEEDYSHSVHGSAYVDEEDEEVEEIDTEMLGRASMLTDLIADGMQIAHFAARMSGNVSQETFMPMGFEPAAHSGIHGQYATSHRFVETRHHESPLNNRPGTSTVQRERDASVDDRGRRTFANSGREQPATYRETSNGTTKSTPFTPSVGSSGEGRPPRPAAAPSPSSSLQIPPSLASQIKVQKQKQEELSAMLHAMESPENEGMFTNEEIELVREVWESEQARLTIVGKQLKELQQIESLIHRRAQFKLKHRGVLGQYPHVAAAFEEFDTTLNANINI